MRHLYTEPIRGLERISQQIATQETGRIHDREIPGRVAHSSTLHEVETPLGMMGKSLALELALASTTKLLICIMGITLQFAPEHCCERQCSVHISACYWIKQRKHPLFLRNWVTMIPSCHECTISTLKCRRESRVACEGGLAKVPLSSSTSTPPSQSGFKQFFCE